MIDRVSENAYLHNTRPFYLLRYKICGPANCFINSPKLHGNRDRSR